MYEFHNSYIKQRYLDSSLQYTDIDSFTYQIQKDNVYEGFYTNKHLLDLSGYEKESPFYNDKNKKVIGKMKDKLNGEITEEFVGLRAKIYPLNAKKEEMKKGKGVKKNVVKKRH